MRPIFINFSKIVVVCTRVFEVAGVINVVFKIKFNKWVFQVADDEINVIHKNSKVTAVIKVNKKQKNSQNNFLKKNFLTRFHMKKYQFT